MVYNIHEQGFDWRKIEEKVMGTKDKLLETFGIGGREGERAKKKCDEELGPGAATKLEGELAKTSSDGPTKRVEGPGKSLGKEESGVNKIVDLQD